MAVPFQLENPAGLWALLSLVPLIILYLIRPKPRPMAIPSLMFFLKSSGSRKLTSFLKQLTHDWLFFIQLLFVGLLAFTFAHPFSNYEHDITASNTVIVLDVSASMQTYEGSNSRFDLAIAQAKKVLGSKNSIILAKDVPYLALQDATADDANRFFNSLQPKQTPTRLGEAILLAGETLSEGRVVVISDFINTGGQDPDIAKMVLERKGLVVDFINVAQPNKRNVGIVQIDPGAEQTTLYLKNYNPALENVGLTVGDLSTTLSIAGQSIETYSFKTPPGVTRITLNVRDDFSVDNTAYVSAPSNGKARVLLVSNNVSTFLKNALLAAGDISLDISAPPIIPRQQYDVVVLNAIDINQILPGTFEDLKTFAQAGGTIIVAVQPNSASLDYKGLLPVKLSRREDGGFISVEQLNRFTKNIDFGKTNTFSHAELIGEQVVVATVHSIPIITIQPLGSGKLVYYGIPEDADFKYSPHYPIFWTELMKYVTAQQDVRNLNLKAGETLILDTEQILKTPTRTIKRSALQLDETGIYQLEDRVLAVNLVNEQESQINLNKQIGTKSVDYKLTSVKETRKFPWDLWLIAAGLFMLLFEIFFTKYRGDL